MQRMIFRSFSGLAVGMLTFASIASLGCGGGGSTPDGAVAGEEIECGGKKRAAADCGAMSAPKVSGATSKSEETAIARINASVEEINAEQARLCKSYNACEIDEAAFSAGSGPLKERIEKLRKSADVMADASASYGTRKRALDEAYRGVVPVDKRLEELTFRMGIQAELPASVGGGNVDIEPGSVLPTNARVAFSFEVSKEAHLYIFQRTPSDEVTVLFPDPRIGTQNPLRGGTWLEIPPNGQRFRVNDKDIGDENVYIVASQTPIQSLDAALQKVKSGAVTKITQDDVLKAFTSVVPGTPKVECARGLEFDAGEGSKPIPECTRTRGLVLDVPQAADSKISAPMPGGGGPGKRTVDGVLEVRTDPGDSVIVKVFPFKHVTEQDYSGAKKALEAAAQKGVKTRGIVMEF